jgi:hypothetical protein
LRCSKYQFGILQLRDRNFWLFQHQEQLNFLYDKFIYAVVLEQIHSGGGWRRKTTLKKVQSQEMSIFTALTSDNVLEKLD